jgi:hypothetical protein
MQCLEDHRKLINSMLQDLNSTIIVPFEALIKEFASVKDSVANLQKSLEISHGIVGFNRTVEQGMGCSFVA